MGLPDGGFEQGTTHWTLATECDLSGAFIETNLANVRTGLKALRLESSKIGQKCGHATSTASGLLPGKPHDLIVYAKSQGVSAGRRLEILFDNAVVFTSTQVFEQFTRLGPFSVTPAGATASVRFEATDGAGLGSVTWWLDDASLEPTESVLERVAAAIDAEVKKIPGIGETGLLLRHWTNVSVRPAAFTAFASEDGRRDPTRSIQQVASFIVATVVSGDVPVSEFFKLQRQIKQQIEDDPTLGGIVQDAWVSGSAALVTDETIAAGLHVADVFITVEYRRDRGKA